jgi:hypothetical protein
MFTGIVTGKSIFGVRDEMLTEPDQMQLMLKSHIKALFNSILEQLPKELADKLSYCVSKLKLDYLLLGVIFKKGQNIKEILKTEKLLGFNNTEVLKTLEDIVIGNRNIGNINSLIKASLPYIEGRYPESHGFVEDFKKGKMSIQINNIKFNNKAVKGLNEMYKKFDLKPWSESKIIMPKRRMQLNKRYGFELNKDGILIDIPELFETMIQIAHKDKNALFAFLKMTFPLFREIPGAMEILQISEL